MQYSQMIKDIEELVNTDFCLDMASKTSQMPIKEYTQGEAKRMADIIGDVYEISHSFHCKACRGKYE